MKSKLIYYLKHPKKVFKYLILNNIIKVPDKMYLKLIYKERIGKNLNLKNPKTFNEKLQWLKLYDRKKIYTTMVDKYEAKKYVANIIGDEYIIPTIGIYENFNEIDFNKLPNRFVIKCTHDSGGTFICNNKEDINWNDVKMKINKSLKNNYYYHGREWPYKNIKPRIIVEQNIQELEKTEQVNDYKLMCFNGKVKCSFVCSNRDSKEGLCVNFYDELWNPMPFERHYPKNKNEISKPTQYDKMKELAEKLSKNITFLRVDFYQIKEKIYFGELTFYPGNGLEEFTPDEWDTKLGNLLDLSEVNKNEK